MTDSQRAEAEKLLRAGESQSAVAAATGVPKTTIGKFALRRGLGRRGTARKKRREPSTYRPKRAVVDRCPRCRKLMEMPCRFCQIADVVEARGVKVR